MHPVSQPLCGVPRLGCAPIAADVRSAHCTLSAATLVFSDCGLLACVKDRGDDEFLGFSSDALQPPTGRDIGKGHCRIGMKLG